MSIARRSLEELRPLQLRPMVGTWGLIIAGAGLLGGSACAVPFYHHVIIACLALTTGLVAWWIGKRPALISGIVAGSFYPAATYLLDGMDPVQLLRAVPVPVGLLGLALVVSEQKYLVTALARSSMLDHVTRLPGYELLLEFIERESHRSMRYRQAFCVAVLELQDLDGLSRNLGHWRTDKLLKDLARAMGDSLRKSDILGHIGGNRFGVVLPMTTSDGTRIALRKVIDASRALTLQTNGCGASAHHLSWLVGLAEFPADGRSALELLRAAQWRLSAPAPGLIAPSTEVTASPHRLRPATSKGMLPWNRKTGPLEKRLTSPSEWSRKDSRNAQRTANCAPVPLQAVHKGTK